VSDPQGSDEAAFLASYDAEGFERPSLAVDVVLLTVIDRSLQVLVIRRDQHPFAGCWTLPGGFVGIDESLSDAARRVLADKTGLRGVFLEQLHAFGDPGRDPRMRIVSVGYVALVDASRAPEGPGRWARVEVPWAGVTGGPVTVSVDDEPQPLGFDHDRIAGTAVRRLRERLDASPIGFQLLPERFTLRELQAVHETILGHGVNKDSFRRRMLATGQLEATGEREQAVGHRPAELYRFHRRAAV